MRERHACGLVGQWRTTQRYQPTQCEDEDRLTQAILALAGKYGRFGYRRITALLKLAGWQAGKDRVQRIWLREGLKVPAKQKPRGRLWLNDGGCVRLRPTHRNHVWSYDFVEAQTHDHGLRARVLLKTPHNAVRVFRINFHEPRLAVAALARDQRATRASKKVRDDVARLTAV